LLAESHISIHTWPEHAFAAIDIFMCGGCNPAMAVPRLRADFAAQRMQTHTQRRGLLGGPS
jgi:S-adenosylmethionine decarboxylase